MDQVPGDVHGHPALRLAAVPQRLQNECWAAVPAGAVTHAGAPISTEQVHVNHRGAVRDEGLPPEEFLAAMTGEWTDPWTGITRRSVPKRLQTLRETLQSLQAGMPVILALHGHVVHAQRWVASLGRFVVLDPAHSDPQWRGVMAEERLLRPDEPVVAAYTLVTVITQVPEEF